MSSTISINPVPPARPAAELAVSARSAVDANQPKAATSLKVEPSLSAAEVRNELKRTLKELNEQSRKEGRKLNFSIDDEVNRVVITVRQTETGEVIRQIPSEAVLRLAHNLKAIRGLLLNETT